MTEMICVSARAGSPPAHRSVHAGQRRRGHGRRLRAHQLHREDRRAARALGRRAPPSHVGRHGRAVDHRRLGRRRSVTAALRSRQRRAAPARRGLLAGITAPSSWRPPRQPPGPGSPARTALRTRLLLSSFLSPLTNRRTRRYGAPSRTAALPAGGLRRGARGLARGPPSHRADLATDWHDGGTDVDDAVRIARAFAEHGAAGIDVSTGQVVATERPAFATQLPDALRRPDPQPRSPRARRRGDAVGAISSWDDVQLDPARRPRRPVRAGPPAPVRRSGRGTRPPSRVRGSRRGVARPLRRGQPPPATGSRRRAAAPAGPGAPRRADHPPRQVAPARAVGGRVAQAADWPGYPAGEVVPHQHSPPTNALRR